MESLNVVALGTNMENRWTYYNVSRRELSIIIDSLCHFCLNDLPEYAASKISEETLAK